MNAGTATSQFGGLLLRGEDVITWAENEYGDLKSNFVSYPRNPEGDRLRDPNCKAIWHLREVMTKGWTDEDKRKFKWQLWPIQHRWEQGKDKELSYYFQTQSSSPGGKPVREGKYEDGVKGWLKRKNYTGGVKWVMFEEED